MSVLVAAVEGVKPAGVRDRPAGRNLDLDLWCRLLAYLRVVMGLIERRAVGLAEILEVIARGMGQQGMAGRRRIDQSVDRLHGKPP